MSIMAHYRQTGYRVLHWFAIIPKWAQYTIWNHLVVQPQFLDLRQLKKEKTITIAGEEQGTQLSNYSMGQSWKIHNMHCITR